MDATALHTSVLVVGGGPVGMALGVELSRFGVDSVVVERNASTTEHPKSRGCTSRTMEDFRIWGIEEEVRAGAVEDGPSLSWLCRSITGKVLGTTISSPSNIHTPAAKSMVAQDVIERALFGKVAGERHCTMFRSHEVTGFEQDADGVTGRVRSVDGDREFEVRAAYMIACDGAGSRVRKALGIEMIGPPVLATMANYYYWADTSRLVPAAVGPVIYHVFPEDPAMPVGRIAPSGPDRERWLQIEPIPDEQELLTEEQLIPIVRTHWGIPDLEVRLINSMKWRMSAQVPETFRSGRVLLAGDAAHRFPPAGGMGLNSGIQDVRNLGWKLAMVIRHGANDRLLDTYELERRPIAESNNQWSIGNAQRLPRVDDAFRRPDAELDPEQVREILVELSDHQNSDGQGYGIPYERGALIPDGTPAPSHDARIHWPSDRTGTRFPHMWLDVERRQSTLDWFDRSFVLVCGPDATEWSEAGEKYAAESAAPFEVRRLPGMYAPFTFAADQALLVRPDGVVAWRPTRDDDPLPSLRTAMEQILQATTV